MHAETVVMDWAATVLARALDTTDQADAANRSAVATQAGSVRTAAELLVGAAQLAAMERITTWLDQLTDTGDPTFEVPGGRCATVISSPVSVASSASWVFHSRSREPWEPPPAVISSRVAPG